MSLAVVTDSSSCLPADLARARGIGVVPLHATTGDGDRPGSTSRPSPDELAHAYAHAARGADEVLALHLAASLSGTADAATRAAEKINQALGRRVVTVLDSGTTGGALGQAAIAASGAATADDGVERARDLVSRSAVLFLVDDLAHLRRGGRLDRRTALLGGALGVRPILRVTADGIRPVEAVRGAKRARARLAELAAGLASQGAGAIGQTGLIIHADDGTAARALIDAIAAGAPGEEPHGPTGADATAAEAELQAAPPAGGRTDEPARFWPFDPALSVHVGPGALGCVIISPGSRGTTGPAMRT
ncbi:MULTISPECIES: DegV family protein [Actinomyces]|uniref:DegV family EDD domain-containing protein n=1 Tax=Actinomyces marmotae TaxID=2737173 RepID=A0A6M8B5F6_9ACTO|nr:MULTISPECIES: DegV family protein [Actinomyces]QKD79897.1 DegV family EDD domain-containing protein [Actinomyces marmotae]